MVRKMEQLRLHTIIPQFGLYGTFFFVSPLDMCLVLMQWHLVSWAALESQMGKNGPTRHCISAHLRRNGLVGADSRGP